MAVASGFVMRVIMLCVGMRYPTHKVGNVFSSFGGEGEMSVIGHKTKRKNIHRVFLLSF
jgi:hypothetical protein